MHSDKIHFLFAIMADVFAFGLLFSGVELFLKIIVAVSATGYTLWKWYRDYQDRKKLNKR